MPITTYYLLPCYRSVTIYPAFGAGPFWGNNKCRRFSRIHSRAVYCAQTYSAKLFMSPPTGAVCHRRLGDAKRRKGCGEVVYRKDGSRERHDVASFTSPLSVTQTNVQSRGRGVQISFRSAVKLLWKSVDGHWGGLCCVLHPVSAEVVRGCPITGWDKIRGQLNYASAKREGDYIFFYESESLSTPVWPFMLELLAVWPLLEVILMTRRCDSNRGALFKRGPRRLPQQMFYKESQKDQILLVIGLASAQIAGSCIVLFSLIHGYMQRITVIIVLNSRNMTI